MHYLSIDAILPLPSRNTFALEMIIGAACKLNAAWATDVAGAALALHWCPRVAWYLFTVGYIRRWEPRTGALARSVGDGVVVGEQDDSDQSGSSQAVGAE